MTRTLCASIPAHKRMHGPTKTKDLSSGCRSDVSWASRRSPSGPLIGSRSLLSSGIDSSCTQALVCSHQQPSPTYANHAAHTMVHTLPRSREATRARNDCQYKRIDGALRRTDLQERASSTVILAKHRRACSTASAPCDCTLAAASQQHVNRCSRHARCSFAGMSCIGRSARLGCPRTVGAAAPQPTNSKTYKLEA